MNISGVGLIKGDESKGYADPTEGEGNLVEQSQYKALKAESELSVNKLNEFLREV